MKILIYLFTFLILSIGGASYASPELPPFLNIGNKVTLTKGQSCTYVVKSTEAGTEVKIHVKDRTGKKIRQYSRLLVMEIDEVVETIHSYSDEVFLNSESNKNKFPAKKPRKRKATLIAGVTLLTLLSLWTSQNPLPISELISTVIGLTKPISGYEHRPRPENLRQLTEIPESDRWQNVVYKNLEEKGHGGPINFYGRDGNKQFQLSDGLKEWEDGNIIQSNGAASFELFELEPSIEKHTRMINMLLLLEDEFFFENANGVNFKRILSAILNNVMGRSLQGASTIDMQAAKVSFSGFTYEQSFSQKSRQFRTAIEMNKVLSKNDILNIYLNNSNFHPHYMGIVQGSLIFFGERDPSNLTYFQLLQLFTALKNPNFDMFGVGSERNLKQIEEVYLQRLADKGFFSTEEFATIIIELNKSKKSRFDAALKRDITQSFYPRNGAKNLVAQTARDIVVNYLSLGEDRYKQGFLDISTTIQKDQIILQDILANISRRYGANAATFVLIGDNKYQDKAEVLNILNFPSNLNLAKKPKGIASTEKAIVLPALLTEGIGLNLDWFLRSDSKYFARLTNAYRRRRKNIRPILDYYQKAGIDIVFDQKVDEIPPLGWGVIEISPIDMANIAYNFSRGKDDFISYNLIERIDSTIETSGDNTIYKIGEQDFQEFYPEFILEKVNRALIRNTQSGTATSASLPHFNLGAKTGTHTKNNVNVRASCFITLQVGDKNMGAFVYLENMNGLFIRGSHACKAGSEIIEAKFKNKN